MRVIIIIFCAMLFVSDCLAFSPLALDAYVARCSASIESQGFPSSASHKFCRCIATGMDKEFKDSEFELMINAQPNPNGNASDKRLYRAISPCYKIIEK